MASSELSTRTGGVAPEIIRVATARVCASEIFKYAPDLQQLLRFLTDSELSVRSEKDRWHEICELRYRDISNEEAKDKLGTDLEQLSQRLSEYYADEGRDDPLRLTLLPSRLGLRFDFWDGEGAERIDQASVARRGIASSRTVSLLVIACVLMIGVPLVGAYKSQMTVFTPEAPKEARTAAELAVLQSLPRTDGLSAKQIVDLGRPMMFPLINLEGQKQATALFKKALEQDPDSAFALASAVHSMINTVMLTQGSASGSGRARRSLFDAKKMLEQAQALAPKDPWVQSAAAWLEMGQSNPAKAGAMMTPVYE